MKRESTMKYWMLGISLMILGGGMNSNSMSGVGDFAKAMAERALEPRHVSWKEEVLLHDGKKLIVERSQSYGGRHEIGQRPPIKEEKITFSLPGSSQTIVWTSEYSEDVGRANFEPLALHISNNMPYIVATPNLCLAYNKWGRPNPPYVVFKYDGKAWRRIPLSKFPAEFKEINLVISTTKHDSEVARKSLVRANVVKKLNSSLTQPEYRTIVREPLASSHLCPPELTGFKAPYPIPPKAGGAGGK